MNRETMNRAPCERCDVPSPFAAGSRKASRRQSRTKAGWLADITEEVLKDTTKLMALMALSDLPADHFGFQRNVIALAVHVMTSKGVRNPVGTFIAKIRKRDWSTITNEDEDEAVKRHRDWLGMQAPRRRRNGEPITDPGSVGDAMREMYLLME